MNQTRTFTLTLAFPLLVGVTGRVDASSFQLQESSASQLGTAYAGAGSSAEDVSTAFFNAATLMEFDDPQVAISTVGIFPRSKLYVSRATSGVGTVSGSGVDRINGNTLVPGLHLGIPLSDSWAFGLNIGVPFGLKTIYSDSALTRYIATLSKLETTDISPSIAYRVHDRFAIAVGFDAVYTRAWLDVAISTSAANGDGYQKNYGKHWGYGGHAGIIYDFSDCSRVGLSFYSKVHVPLKGDRHQVRSAGSAETVTPIESVLDLPERVRLSLTHGINSQWNIMADVDWTKWTRFKDLIITQTTDNSQSISHYNYKNGWKVAFGTSYHFCKCPAWTAKCGIAYDFSPAHRDSSRSARIPDSNRFWLALGAKCQFHDCIWIDAGYACLWFKRANIADTAPLNSAGTPVSLATVNGRTKLRSHLVGIQLTWNFL